MKKKVEKALKEARKVEKHKLLTKKQLQEIQDYAEKEPSRLAKIVKSTSDWFMSSKKPNSRRRKAYK